MQKKELALQATGELDAAAEVVVELVLLLGVEDDAVFVDEVPDGHGPAEAGAQARGACQARADTVTQVV